LDSNWKNELILERDSREHIDVYRKLDDKKIRYFHIKVKIEISGSQPLIVLPISKVSRICKRERTSIETVEIKWKGINFQTLSYYPTHIVILMDSSCFTVLQI